MAEAEGPHVASKYFLRDNVALILFVSLISGIINQKQTVSEAIDIVQPVSSSLPKRMDLNPACTSVAGFFFVRLGQISTVCLI
jgi:hypothetical protein